MTALGKQATILRKAWMNYGLLCADNGNAWATLAGKDGDWDLADLGTLQFQQNYLKILKDMTEPLNVTPPRITALKAEGNTLTWTVIGDANCYVQGFPPTRGNTQTVSGPGTYRLVAQNYGGRVIQEIRVP